MDQEIISRKLLLTSCFISIFILILYTVIYTFKNKPVLAFCNIEDKINIILRIGTNDILVNPIGSKQALECIGKNMPFYDRTIEVVITTKEADVELIKQRYTVKKVVTGERVNIGDILITQGAYIGFEYNNRKIVIVQRPLSTINEILLRNYTEVVRPISESNIEQILNTMIKQETVLNKGQVEKFIMTL